MLPEHRHKGAGTSLIHAAIEEIARRGPVKASVGIINENTVLKEWYIGLGFTVTGAKKFEHLPFTVCFLEIKVNMKSD